jgi:hypothetical protein
MAGMADPVLLFLEPETDLLVLNKRGLIEKPDLLQLLPSVDA